MELLTLTEAAIIANVSSSALRYAIRGNRLKPYRKVGKTWLIRRDDLETWMSVPSLHKRGVKSKK